MNQRTFSFPQIINRETGVIEMSTNTKSINECLGVLLRTRPGELLGDPNWGCNLITRVFQYQGVIVESLIKEDILTAVANYEPRIIMTTENIVLEVDDRKLNIYLTYTIKATGVVNTFNMSVVSSDNPERT